MRQTERETKGILVVALTTSAGTTPEIDISHHAQGEVFVAADASSPMTTLTYYVAPTAGGTYLPAYDASGNAVTQTVVNERAYPIPSSVFGAACIKIVANNVGNVGITLKS